MDEWTDSRFVPDLVVGKAEFAPAQAEPGPVFIPTGEDPRQFYKGGTEAVEVPWDLAQRIRAAADLVARLKEARTEIGRDLARSGLLRKVDEGATWAPQ